MTWEYGLSEKPSTIEDLNKEIVKLRNEIIMLNDNIKEIWKTIRLIVDNVDRIAKCF
jgi:hypothetical protein